MARTESFIEGCRKVARTIVPPQYRPEVKRFLYFGKRVHCPVCTGDFRRFEAIFRRKGAMCPVCGAMERHRMIWLYLTRELDIICQSRIRIFHLAPEAAIKTPLCRLKHIAYVSGDLTSETADVLLDATRIPFAQSSFDALICCHVLEHINDDRKVMEEFYRMLIPGGWALLQHPIPRAYTYEDTSVTTPEDRKRVFGQKDHVRIYGMDLKNRLEAVGFEVTVIDYPGMLSKAEVLRYGLKPGELIFFCRKG